MTGEKEDFIAAAKVFLATLQDETASEDARKEAGCILSRCYRITGNVNEFFKLALKDMITTPCAEICCELGNYFLTQKIMMKQPCGTTTLPLKLPAFLMSIPMEIFR